MRAVGGCGTTEVLFFLRNFQMESTMFEKCCCYKETSRVHTEVLVSFTLLLIDTMKWPRRILDSLFDLATFLKNHQHTLSLN